MDLTVIDSSTWMPTGAPLTHYKSLIWTERYVDTSSFELTTYAVKHTMDKLPLGTLVSLRQSREVMRVESHEITHEGNEVQVLTVRGYSLTSYLDYRVIGEKRGKKYQAMTNSNLASAAVLLYNSFVNPDAFDLTIRAAAYYKNPKDAIPNVAVTESTGEFATSTQGPGSLRYLNPGTIREPVKNFLLYRPYGLRIVRPPYSAYKISVAQDGVVTYPWTEDITELCFDLYKGIDRSSEQSTNEAVVFDTEIDDLIQPSYLLGVKSVRTEAHICLDTKAVFAQSSDPSGLSRRVIFLDGGEPETGFDQTEWEDHNIAVAEKLLEDYKRVSIVDGEVSPQSKIKFNRDYFLGDLVTVRGRYGALSQARVTEFIRAQDENGETNYPGLSYIRSDGI